MSIRLNKEKSIGKVLFIVEGGRTEPFLLHRIFCKILNASNEVVCVHEQVANADCECPIYLSNRNDFTR